METRRQKQLFRLALVTLAVSAYSCSDDAGKTASQCGECTDSEVCIEGVCIDGVRVCSEELVCDVGQVCQDGGCVAVDPCAGKVCGEGLVCDAGECVPVDLCASVTCLDGHVCVGGACIEESCVEDGKEKACPEGQMCHAGNCIDDGCLSVTCDEGWECVKGECEESACIGKICGDGRTCVAGDCIDNECLSMECEEGLVCAKGTCMYEACVDKDPCAQGKVCQEDGECAFVEAPVLSHAEVEDAETDELGKSITVGLTLNNPPSEDVRIECEVVTESPNVEAVASCENILFDATNWNQPQYVVITGQGDDIIDGDQNYSVSLKTVSEDAEFHGLETVVEGLKNLDVDTAEIRVEGTDLKTGEDGTTADILVSLSSKPTADVVIGVSSDNTAEGTVSTDSLTFTPETWNIPQTVTVTGVDDEAQDGNQTYHVVFENTVSEDANFNDLEIAPVTVVNQDNDVAGFMVSPEEIVTDEAGNNGKVAKVSFKLNTLPSADVDFTLTVSDEKEAVVSENAFTIARDSWKDVKEITVVGVADNLIDGDKAYTIKIVTTSDDGNYNGLEQTVKGVNLDLDKAGVSTLLTEEARVTEAGSSVSVGIQLLSIPTDNVVVKAAVEDDSELSVSPDSLTFTAETWNQAQTFVVKGVDDPLIDGDITSALKITTSSADTHFEGTEAKLTFVTIDDDVAGLVIQSEGGSYKEDSGATATITVVLTAQPEKDVTIYAVSSDITELAVSQGAPLTFTPENWNKPQTVTLKVVDDKQADGNQVAFVKFASTSEDAHFNGLAGVSAEYTIIDNETASVVLATKSYELYPGAYSTEMSAVLSSEPLSDVTVALTTTNPKSAKLSVESVKFTSSDWNVPKTFTVTMTDETALLSVVNMETISGIASGGGVYSGLKSNDITLSIYRFLNDLVFEYTGSVQKTTLYPGKYKLEVWGAQGGNGSSSSGTTSGGKGGYSAGVLSLTEKTEVFVYVGGQGQMTVGNQTGTPGFNGGGALPAHSATSNSSKVSRGSGGGATDIRLVNDSLYARVIVAGGGGGAGGFDAPSSCAYSEAVGAGGGTNGIAGPNLLCSTGTDVRAGGGEGTQVAGGIYGLFQKSTSPGTATTGTFGVGGTGGNVSGNYYCGGSGGGGWYGGGGGAGGGGFGGGGSGWVYTEANDKAGYTDSAKTGGTWLLNSKHYLTSSQSIAGNTPFTSPSGTTETGHAGNGYARISIVK